MDKPYPVEEEFPINIIEFQSILKPSLLNIKLIINEQASRLSATRIIYTNKTYYERADLLLTLPNGEKFKGVLGSDSCSLKKGEYFWPNGQKYYGEFDNNNNFFTPEGQISQLTFPNGDVFEGSFINGNIGEGKMKSKEGIEIEADFTGGKINGSINLKDIKRNFVFNGYVVDNKKEGECYMEVKIHKKLYSIKGNYENGLKNGLFTIAEISPNKGNLYIKGHYKDGQRHGYFDIIDKEKEINVSHRYITFLTPKMIEKYNKKYKAKLTGNENSLSFTCRNNPVNQLADLVNIQLGKLLTLDISRSKINSISFLNTEESTLFSLQNLILSYNNIKSIEPLTGVHFEKLKKLIANDNQIENISCISDFKFEDLEELNLSSNPIKSLEGADKWDFPNLVILTLSRTDIKDISPLYEGDFPNLIQIDLFFSKVHPYNHITPELFKKCTSLKNVIFESSH